MPKNDVVAWAAFTQDGNLRIWTQDYEAAQKASIELGITIRGLVFQSALESEQRKSKEAIRQSNIALLKEVLSERCPDQHSYAAQQLLEELEKQS